MQLFAPTKNFEFEYVFDPFESFDWLSLNTEMGTDDLLD
jgi:hypothetical protein